MAVYYEWVAEEIDESENIVDTNFADRLSDVLRYRAPNVHIGLVRTVGCDSEGVEYREWAYPDPDMPERFDGGSKVPQRFLAEWNRRS